MKSIAFKSVTLVGCLATLIASGGGEEPRIGTPASLEEAATLSINTFLADTAPASTMSITGSAVTGNSRNYDVSTNSVGAERTGNRYTMFSGTNQLITENGATISGEGGVLFDPYEDNSQSKKAVTFLYVRDLDAETFEYTVGTAGFETPDANMPTTGSITFTGEGGGFFRDYLNGSTFTLDNGTSNVNVNFATHLANVTITGFEFTRTDGNSTAPDFNQIQGQQINISGNQLSGGNWNVLDNGISRTWSEIGDVKASIMTGNFYGYNNTTGQPVEVGGGFILDGTSGGLVGVFLGY